jgi:chaperonin GroEL
MVEETSDFETSLDFQEGMEFSNGYLSPGFVTDKHRMIAEYAKGKHYVLVTDYSIADGMDLVPIIEKVVKEGGGKSALLVIAGDVIGPALSAMVLTYQKSQVPLIAVMAPEYADQRKQMLEDIAILTGGQAILAESGQKLKDVELNQLGRLRSMRVSQTHTMIVPDNPDSEEIKERCSAIKEQIEAEENEFRRDKMKTRLAKLSSGVATINVGGGSDTEIGERRERVIDAVYATKAAVSDGVVVGGGMTLWAIADRMDTLFTDDNKDTLELIKRALRKPLEILLTNSGLDLNLLKTKFKENEGIDVITGKKVDLYEEGIIDPVMVTKLAIKHSFSVAAMMITTSCLVCLEPEDNVQNMRIVNAQ